MPTLKYPLILLILLFIRDANSYGARELGEECGSPKFTRQEDLNPYNYNPNTYYPPAPPVPDAMRCRTEKGLYCNEYSRRCRCHELSGSIWNDELERCELAIDNFCTTKIAIPSRDGLGIDYEHFCPEDSECTCNYHHYDRRYWTPCKNENGLCKCKWGYRPYEDRRGCWYSGGNSLMSSAIMIFTMVVLFRCIV